MLVSVQALATYLEQDVTRLSQLQKDRYVEHITTAGDEVRGALAALYRIPLVTRDAAGLITAPLVNGVPIADPVRTALGPVVKMLASAYLLDPARGIQPQEDRSAAADYRASARAQLKALASTAAFVAPIEDLPRFGIQPTPALIAALNLRKAKARPGLRQQREGLFGVYHDPATGEAFDRAAVSEGEG